MLKLNEECHTPSLRTLDAKTKMVGAVLRVAGGNVSFRVLRGRVVLPMATQVAESACERGAAKRTKGRRTVERLKH